MYSVKKSKATTAKFKNFAVNDSKNFVDLESGEIVGIQDIIAKTFGEDTPIDISVTNKQEDDVTPDAE